MHNRKDHLLALIVIVVVAFAAASFGQVLKGSISGSAADPQGAVIPGAQVKATNTATGTVLSTTTDASGLFRFSLIPAGEYKVEISAPNFNSATQNNIAVSAGRDTGLGTIKLQVGQASTTVEVTAGAPLIETTQSQITNTITGTQLSTFAGIQENQGLDNLALFVPGVVSSRDNNFSNTNGGLGFSSNGLRGRNNDQQIDGQNNNDNSVAGPALFVSDPEFVQQYVLVTNQFGPEYGRNSGSVVNIITKSGGNNWHGSVFSSINNSVLNAMSNFQKQFQQLDEPPRLQNTFGGFTVGGPIVKNKMFFFGGFDTNIISSKTVFSSDNLTPTPAGLATLAGCFPSSASLTALSTAGPYGISAGSPAPLGAPVTGVVTACPAAEFAGVSRTLETPAHIFDWIMRTDLQLGQDTITGRYLFNRNNIFNSEDNGAAGYVVNVPALSQAVLLSWTHNISSRMVNELRGSFGRTNVEFGGNNIGNTEPTIANIDQGVTNVSFATGGLLGFGPATNLPQGRIVNTWQGQDNWNYVMGKHQLKAGVNFTYQRSPNVFLPNINGAFRFNDWNQYFANTPSLVNIAEGASSLDFREYDTFVYVGDDWKASQGLTLNLGLTWSYYGQPANLFHDLTTTRESNPATAFWNPGLPLSVRTFPTIPAPTSSFGPSFGFAYSPQGGGRFTGNGKTTIRGGYRLLYDPPFYNIYLNIATSAPQVFLQSFRAPGGLPTASFGLPADPIGPNVRTLLSPSLTPGVLDPRSAAETTVTPHFGPDMIHTWTFGLEREVSKNSAVEARYVGNAARHLFQSVNANPFVADLQAGFPNLVPGGVTPCATPVIPPGPGQTSNPDLGRVNCGTGVLRERTNGGFSNYNAFQFEYRANNLFNQLTMRTSYTFSKTLDNVSEIFSTFGAGNSVAFAQNPFNTTSGEYGFSGIDYPHQWSILATEQLPFFKDQHGFTGHMLGGWSFAANYILASGQRYTPSQLFAAQASAAGNFYDSRFLGSFNSGVDSARPFLGNKSAPSASVGIFAADACTLFGACTTAASNPTAVLSLNALNQTPTGGTPIETTVTNSQVRFIVNGGEAQTVFGTPFGNAPRNFNQDAITNIANLSVYKRLKFSEHVNFEVHATAANVFNHPNFLSVDPFVEDAGLQLQLTGFGNPALSNSQPRTLFIGGKLTF
jgi:hypothetical protein